MPKHLALALLAISATLSAQTIASKTAGMKHIDGYLPLDWDAKTGKLYLEITHLDADGKGPDILYTHSLPYGTGSNDLGLDRGQISRGQLVHFQRTGPKVLLIEPNQRFRSTSTDPNEVLAVRQSFPESVLFGFKVEAEDPSGTVLVDATDFFLRDAHEVAGALTRTQQGAYKLDATRSTIALDATKAFPKNTEVEAILTFTTDGPARGEFVRDVTPDPHALTVREHQSFVELPGPGFTPRRFDPRAGYFPTSYRDYNVPVSESLDQQFIIRHRLIKKDPSCKTNCEAVAPIQYYVDSGAAEPIRTALLEGARWWDQAFQAAGWAKGTFKADILPAGADPNGHPLQHDPVGPPLHPRLELRRRRRRSTHRRRSSRATSPSAPSAAARTTSSTKPSSAPTSTANPSHPRPIPCSPWSSSAPANSPRTRPDTPSASRTTSPPVASPTHPKNPSPSWTTPIPWVTLDKNGVPNLSQSYATNIGIWDKVAIDYGYREFDKSGKPTEDTTALNAILTASEKTGLIYITDEDSRPFGGAHPHSHLWDNGTDPADELNRIMTVRTAALKRFGENAITTGTPMAQLEDTLVPLYLLHRYQTEATIKEIGGLDYRYNLRGDGQPNPEIVSSADQKKALAAVLVTLSPETLTLPESLLKILPPRPPGLERTRESFPSETGLTFDPIAAAESAADLTLAVLLDPARASRLVQYHMRVPDAPSLRGVLEAVSKTTAERPEGGHTMSSEVERAVEFRALEAMLALAVNPKASTQARAIARSHVNDILKQWTAAAPLTDTAEAIHRAALIDRINDFNRDPEKFVPAKPIEAPPGMPIGDDEIF